MNPFDSSAGGEAKVKFLDADFVVLRPGAYVICAVTGAKIPLNKLKYWNVDKQQAYATAEASLKGFNGP